MKTERIPVLISWDVDPDRWASLQRRQRALTLALDLCAEFGIRSTFFITANFAHEYPQQIERMRALGQEIGCHGLTHTDEEDYDRMGKEMQRDYIAEAARKLQAASASPVVSFRSPRVKTSAVTLRLLAEQGYRADSSVCSQRVDLVSSNLINTGWIVAPRRPYHPHSDNPYKRGALPIWEIPVSALLLPFISAMLRVLGPGPMKGFSRLLYAESRRVSKPIVYLAHPTEFILSGKQRSHFNIKNLSPRSIRTHGFLLRNTLFRLGGETLFDATRELFSYIASLPGVVFMTCGEYAAQLEREN